MIHELLNLVQINRDSLSVCIQLGDLVTMECIILFYVTFRDLDQGKVKESERLKDDRRLDVSITIHST